MSEEPPKHIFDAARAYAEGACKVIHFDIVRYADMRDGYYYFNIDFTGCPRYTGHPHAVRIDKDGHAFEVTRLKDKWWAYRRAIEREKSF